MNKKFFISFIILGLTIFIGFFASIQSARAGTVQFGDKDIFVNFDGLPFNMNNWAPGMVSAPKTITITNNENFDINIYFGAKSTSSDKSLGNVLTIAINNQSPRLADLFNNNISLGVIKTKQSRSYNITLSFDSEAGNEYQDKTINFSFVIIAEQIGGKGGTQAVIIPGGGAVNIPGLVISNESVGATSASGATITWQTNEFATSRVVYDTVSHPSLGNPPSYGYAFSTLENFKKVTVHKIVLTNLLPGTTYYYRCVSRGSFAISPELTFKTAGQAKQAGNQGGNQGLATTTPTQKTTPPAKQPLAPVGQTNQGTAGGQNIAANTTSSATSLPGLGGKVAKGPKATTGVGGSMLAALGNIAKSKALLAFVIILLLALLYFIVKELILFAKKKRRKR